MGTATSIGFDNIQILSPYPVQSLTELTIIKQPNAHATLCYKGIIPEEMADSYIEKAKVGDTIEVIQTGNGKTLKTLFAGQVASIGVKTVMGVYYLEVEGISGTFNLDIKRKSRSFQNTKMKYRDLVQKVLEEYPEANFKDRVFKDALLEQLIIQHSITDWVLIKQLASQFGAVIIPDCTQAKPNFWIGLPDGAEGTLTDFQYTVVRDLSKYSDTTTNYSDLPLEDFVFYEVESYQYLNLGDQVKFRDKKLRVAKSTAVLHDSILKFTYLIAPEAGIRQNQILNEWLTGTAFEGKIIDRAKDKIKVHLEIGQEQPVEEACWIPYAGLRCRLGIPVFGRI